MSVDSWPADSEAQPTEILDARGGEVDGHRKSAVIEAHTEDHAGKSEAMVAVEVGDADPANRGGGHPGHCELTLCALSGVEQDGGAVPSKDVAVVVAESSG